MKANQKSLPGTLDHTRIFYQSFMDSNDAMLICDNETRILFINKAFSKLYGYGQKELVGQYAGIVRHRDTPKSFFHEMWRDILEPRKGYWRGEIRNRRKDGSPVDVVVTITAIRDDDGQIIAYNSIASDVTEKKQMRKNLVQQEKLFSLGLLASGIAHEIGSPLNVISGRAEMVKSQIREQHPELEKSLEIVVQQTDRISELIKALLNFSRPNAQNSPRDFSQIDVSDVLAECRKLLQKPMKDLGVTFTVRNTTRSTLRWDFFKCEQVVFNLLQNALHAVEQTEDPTVQVTFREATAKELREMDVSNGSGLAVEISDNGAGITEEYLGRVFDPFFTTKDVGMGTGLGLSVVYGLVEEVHGQIRVESKVELGTKFTLLLPRET